MERGSDKHSPKVDDQLAHENADLTHGAPLQARRELVAGNVYLNRGITGALVHRQPFGGFKMSGIGSKAGGADYLLQFVLPRTVTEHTVRRGFAPTSGE